MSSRPQIKTLNTMRTRSDEPFVQDPFVNPLKALSTDPVVKARLSPELCTPTVLDTGPGPEACPDKVLRYS